MSERKDNDLQIVMRRTAERANARLAQALNGLQPDAKDTRRTNIIAAAQDMASLAFAKGERYHAGGRTVYPAKHYDHLERQMFGAMSAQELTLFDDAYNAFMVWHSEIAEESAQNT